jgi:hypothetical protein
MAVGGLLQIASSIRFFSGTKAIGVKEAQSDSRKQLIVGSTAWQGGEAATEE